MTRRRPTICALRLVALAFLSVRVCHALRTVDDSEGTSAVVARQEAHGLRRSSGNNGNFTFIILNKASVPLNILALPKLITIYGTAANGVEPEGNLTFTPGMAAYDFHVVLDDGNNPWNSAGEASWGLTKYGTSYAVSIAVGATTSGTIAVSATAFVTGVFATLVAPPLLVVIAAGTLFGTALLTSMAVSSLTENAMDLVWKKTAKLVKKAQHRELQELDALTGLAGKPFDHPDRLLRFTDVVEDEAILAAFSKSFPDVDPQHVVMTRRHAEAYFTGLLADFKSWAMAKGFNQKWMISGGFTEPKPLSSTTWMKTTFEPLSFGEIKREKVGLCQKTLVISYETLDGKKGQERVWSDWEHVVVAQKQVPGQRADQKCRKRYIALCEESSLKAVTECELQGLDAMGVENDLVWDTVAEESKSLSWSTWWTPHIMDQSTSLHKGEKNLRLLPLEGAGQVAAPSGELVHEHGGMEVKKVSFSYEDVQTS